MINAMHPAFAKKLDFFIRPTDVGAQKIDSTMLNTYKMVVIAFLVMDNGNQMKFFEMIFLVANVGLEPVLGISFLILSGANFDFLDQKLWWKIYTINKAFSNTRRVELMERKEFATTMYNLEHETFIVHVTSLAVASLSSTALNAVYPSRRSQIVGLVAKKTFTKVSN